MATSGPRPTLFGPWGEGVVLTMSGSLIAGMRLGGRDAAVLGDDQLYRDAFTIRNTFNSLPDNCVLSVYYVNTDGLVLDHAPVTHSVADTVGRLRMDFLNALGLSSVFAYLMVEVLPSPGQHGGHSMGNTFATLMKDWRNFFTNISDKKTLEVRGDVLNSMRVQLNDAVSQFCDQTENIFEATPLTTDDIYRFHRFLNTFNSSHLLSTLPIPTDNWQQGLLDGDAEFVDVNSTTMYCIKGAETRYVGYSSAYRFNEAPVPGVFCKGRQNVTNELKNGLLLCRFRPLSWFEKTRFFKERKNELTRMSLDLVKMLKGKTPDEDGPQQSRLQRRHAEDLEEAQMLPDRWGFLTVSAAFFGDHASVVERKRLFHNRMESAGLSVLSESFGIAMVFDNLQLALPRKLLREMPVNIAQFSCVAPFYSEPVGSPVCEDLNAPCAYIFTTRKTTPFHFSLWNGGSGVLIGCGPIRQGKSFTKNSIATHFGKYGGIYRAIDVDWGTTPVAQLYGDDGAAFEIGQDGVIKGFNPFAGYTQKLHAAYVDRIMGLVLSMLDTNASPDAKVMTKEEDKELGRAITNLFKLDNPSLYHFNSLLATLPGSLVDKLSNFHSDGVHADLYTADEDAIGDLNKLYGVFNLAAIKDSAIKKRLVMSEIFFRTTLAFEDPRYRTMPKYLDIDEAHHLIRDGFSMQRLETNILTWGKYLGGVGLWTQSPSHYHGIAGWHALRSAASTMMFTSDPAADHALYGDVFDLTPAEVATIQSMRPKRELLVVQRQKNISVVVQNLVDQQQYALNTSSPLESTRRDELVQLHGFDKGVQLFVEELDNKQQRAA